MPIDSLNPALAAADAERAVLGSLLISAGEFLPQVKAILTQESFSDLTNGKIYKAIVELGENADILTVCDYVTRSGEKNISELVDGIESYLSACMVEVASPLNCIAYANIVFEAWKRRSAMEEMRKAATMLYKGASAAEIVSQMNRLLSQSLQRSDDNDLTIGEIVANYDAERAAEQSNPNGTQGVLTGISDLDRITNGWRKGKFYVVAGRPGDGKSTLMLNFAARAAKKGVRTAVFSLEMGPLEIMRKLVADAAGINTSHQASRGMLPQHWESEMVAKNEISKWPLHLPCGLAYSVADLESKIHRYNMQEPPIGLVIVDYLQLMRGQTQTDNRVAEVSAITRSLKSLSMKLNIPIIAGSQLSRAVSGGEPQLDHLRESGSIEQDADVVLMLHNPAIAGQPNVRKLFIRKNRDGSVGEIPLIAQFQISRFGGAVTTSL